MGWTAFVTGGTGFIGSHLAEALLASGYDEVRCLVRKEAKWLDGLDVKHVRGDLSDRRALEQGVEGADFVYHIAGVTRASSSEALLRANLHGTANLISAVEREAPDSKLIVMSSLAVIGDADVEVATEDTPMNPISAYGRSKAAMELSIRQKPPEVQWVIVRPPSVYGPREADIYLFFRSVSKGIVPILGDPNRPAVSLVHVRDLVRGTIAAAHSDRTHGETYFLGGPRQYSWSEVRDAATAALGKKALPIRVPNLVIRGAGLASELVGRVTGSFPALNNEKAREIVEACKMCSSDKAAAHFAYTPGIDLDAGVREAIEWYLERGWL